MARLNNIFLYGIVDQLPEITKDRATDKPLSGIGYVHVVRGYRDDHTGKPYMKHDHVLIVSLDETVIKEMETWELYDVVNIVGTAATKTMDKPSYCPHCNTENKARGILMYINPVFAQVEKHFDNRKEALSHIIAARELSDRAIVYGTLIKDPTYFKTKAGTVITQYQIALNRKFRIKTDDPSIRTDWPWVKSYGGQAIEDKLRLSKGAEIFVDGVVQSRKINRKTKCAHCGEIYPWTDNTMEFVPYAVEYVSGFKSDEDLEREQGMAAEAAREALLKFTDKDLIEADALSEDIDDESIIEREDNLAKPLAEAD